MNGAERIAAERQRQIDEEGWDAGHDAGHRAGVLARAAVGYARAAAASLYFNGAPLSVNPPEDWPWEKESWKPSGPIRALEKAGALIAAEIDRELVKPGAAVTTRKLKKGDELISHPCELTVVQVEDYGAYAWCSYCRTVHRIDKDAYESGRGSWRPK